MHQETAHAPITLQAGSLTAVYDQGSLRYIRFGSTEVIRQIYFAVRGQAWNTIPAKIISEAVHCSDEAFHIEIVAEHHEGDVHFEWRGTATGGPSDVIRFSINGITLSDFWRSRIGLCVLHPIKECAGQPCRILHSDGQTEDSLFPALISPHQPFLDVRAISYELALGLTAEVRLSGDVFETEDQRNWSDASFKTYSTPLAIPYPVFVKKAKTIRQDCELVVGGTRAPAIHNKRESEEIAVNWDAPSPVGSVGAIWSRGSQRRPYGHLRVDIRCEQPEWKSVLDDAASIGSSLEVAIFSDRPEMDLPRVAQRLRKYAGSTARVLLFPRDGTTTQKEACRIARDCFEDIALGGGSNINFAELNRNRNIAEWVDVVSWAVNPQVHSIEEATIIENLEGQSPAVMTARQFAPKRVLCASPIHVPVFPASAGWAVASLKHLLESQIDSVTYCTDSGALDEICNFGPESVIPSRSSNGLKVDGLVLRRGELCCAWVANFLSKPQRIRIEQQEMQLDSYALVRIELDR